MMGLKTGGWEAGEGCVTLEIRRQASETPAALIQVATVTLERARISSSNRVNLLGPLFFCFLIYDSLCFYGQNKSKNLQNPLHALLNNPINKKTDPPKKT